MSFAFAAFPQRRAREVVSWRESRQKQEKQTADQQIIDKKMAEHREAHGEKLRERLAAGIYRVRKNTAKIKEEIVQREGPQLSVVLKGENSKYWKNWKNTGKISGHVTPKTGQSSKRRIVVAPLLLKP